MFHVVKKGTSMARQVFYSFHFDGDCQRASQVRNIGHLEDNKPIKDNEWEELKKKGDANVEKWIRDQLYGRSCTVVLVGSGTANRKWINHEISETWNEGKGIVGVRVHGLKNLSGYTATAGSNPFSYVSLTKTGEALSSIVKLYDPTVYGDSKATYKNIADNLEILVEEAIKIRAKY
jgi:hypothetical protein